LELLKDEETARESAVVLCVYVVWMTE
jgi:hypothetical protein